MILRLTSQQISHLFWNPKVHYRVHKRPLLIHISCQTNSDPSLSFLFFKIQFNIILLSTLSLSRSIFPHSFSRVILYAFIFSLRATCPIHLILDMIILIIFGDMYEYNKLRNSSLYFLSSLLSLPFS
jgi:hypothetical protein